MNYTPPLLVVLTIKNLVLTIYLPCSVSFTLPFHGSFDYKKSSFDYIFTLFSEFYIPFSCFYDVNQCLFISIQSTDFGIFCKSGLVVLSCQRSFSILSSLFEQIPGTSRPSLAATILPSRDLYPPVGKSLTSSGLNFPTCHEWVTMRPYRLVCG